MKPLFSLYCCILCNSVLYQLVWSSWNVMIILQYVFLLLYSTCNFLTILLNTLIYKINKGKVLFFVCMPWIYKHILPFLNLNTLNCNTSLIIWKSSNYVTGQTHLKDEETISFRLSLVFILRTIPTIVQLLFFKGLGLKSS